MAITKRATGILPYMTPAGYAKTLAAANAYDKKFTSTNKNISPVPADMMSDFWSTDAAQNPPRWAGATDQTVLGSLPPTMGAGQYAMTPGSQALIRSDREDIPERYKRMVRQGLSSDLFEVDHIIPLALGGVNSLYNLQALSKKDHDRKTKVGAIAQNLYFTGTISKAEAVNLATNWDDPLKDVRDVEIKDGALANADADNFAKQKYVQWKGMPEMGFKEGVEGFRGLLPKWLGGKEPESPGGKFYEEAFAQGSDNPLSQLSRGIMTGLSGGWLESQPLPNASALNKMARGVGEIGGTLGSFALTGAALKVTNIAARAALASNVATKALGTVKAGKAGQMAVQTIGKTAETISKTPIWVKAANDGMRIGMGSNSFLTKASTLNKIVNNITLFTTHGQLSKQEENTLGSRMKRFFSDASFGTLLGLVPGRSLKEFAGLGVGTYILSTLEDPNQANAMLNTAVMLGLHGLGGITSKNARVMQESMADKAAFDYLNLKLGVKTKPVGMEITPEDARSYFKQVADSIPGMTADISEARKLSQNAAIAIRQLYKGGLVREARWREEYQDMKSLLERTNQLTEDEIANLPSGLKSFFENARTTLETQRRLPEELTRDQSDPRQLIQAVGIGGEFDPNLQTNIRKWISNNGGEKGDLVIARRMDEQTDKEFVDYINNIVNPKRVAAGKQPYEHPENNVMIFGRDINGNIYNIGYIPSTQRIAFDEYAINKKRQQYGMDEMSVYQNKNTYADNMRAANIEYMVGRVEKVVTGKTSNNLVPIIKFGPTEWTESFLINKGASRKLAGETIKALDRIPKPTQTAEMEPPLPEYNAPLSEEMPRTPEVDIPFKPRAGTISRASDILARKLPDFKTSWITTKGVENQVEKMGLSDFLQSLTVSEFTPAYRQKVSTMQEDFTLGDLFTFLAKQKRAPNGSLLNEQGEIIYKVLFGDKSEYFSANEQVKTFVDNLKLFDKTGQIQQKLPLAKTTPEAQGEKIKTLISSWRQNMAAQKKPTISKTPVQKPALVQTKPATATPATIKTDIASVLAAAKKNKATEKSLDYMEKQRQMPLDRDYPITEEDSLRPRDIYEQLRRQKQEYEGYEKAEAEAFEQQYGKSEDRINWEKEMENKKDGETGYAPRQFNNVRVGDMFDNSMKTAKTEKVKKFWAAVINQLEAKDKNFRERYLPMDYIKKRFQSETVESGGREFKLNTDKLTWDIEKKIKTGQFDKIKIKPLRNIIETILKLQPDTVFITGSSKNYGGKYVNLTNIVKKYVDIMQGKKSLDRITLNKEQTERAAKEAGVEPKIFKQLMSSSEADEQMPIVHTLLYKAFGPTENIKGLNDQQIEMAAKNLSSLLINKLMWKEKGFKSKTENASKEFLPALTDDWTNLKKKI